MNDTKIVEFQQQLENIRMQVGAMKANTPDQDLQLILAGLWDGAVDLQRRLSRPDLIEGYRADAVAQANRVYDLVLECMGQPDEQQLASIGYASDLAASKTKLYQQMVNHAAQVAVLTGMAATEGA